MKTFAWALLAISFLICSCQRAGLRTEQSEGDEILLQLKQLNVRVGVVADKEGIDRAGIVLGEWRYVKIDDSTFMISKSIGLKRHIKYRSDILGKFGTGWSIEDDNGNEEWLP